MGKKAKIFIGIILLAVLFIIETTSVYAANSFDLNVKDNIIYEDLLIDDLLIDADNDSKTAESTYGNNYYRILVHTSYVSADGKELKIVALNTAKSNTSITYKTGWGEGDLVEQIKQLNAGANAYINCKVTFEFGKVKFKEVAQVVKTNVSSISDSTYSLIDGTSFSVGNKDIIDVNEIKDLNGNTIISYSTPKAWNNVENSVPKAYDDIPIPGKYYKLNELSSNTISDPEYLFAFYFDNNRFIPTKSDWSKTEKTEKAIVNNIIPNLSKGDIKCVKYSTPYKIKQGLTLDKYEYHTYEVSYTDSKHDFHRVEFLFVPIGDNQGYFVFMYVYSSPIHAGDILLMLRSLEIK